jgi:ribosomal-protein-serine acetyltransferase
VFTYPLSDGVKLGMLEPWHAEPFLETLEESREHLAKWIPPANTVLTLDDAPRYLQGWAERHANDTGHLFGIWMDAKFIGCVQLFHFDTKLGTCELGVWIAKGAEGRGIMAEACRFVIEWAIRVRGIMRVQWTNSPTNGRSSALARRLGMKLEGILRSNGVQRNEVLNMVIAGFRWDEEVWSMIAEDWPTSAAAMEVA